MANRRGFFLLGVLLLTSCTITSYRDLPDVDVETVPVSPKNLAIYYHVDPIAYLRKAMEAEQADFFISFPAKLEDYRELQRVFTESGIFSAAIPTFTAPEKGVYCAVDVEYIPVSDGERLFLSLSHASGAIFPSYNGSSGHFVRYRIYVDGVLKKTYNYTITKKQAVWAVLFPFYWINGTTYGLDDAFRATAYQFFIDATLDGYLAVS